MADIRTSEIPELNEDWNPFFDPQVQEVLAMRKTVLPNADGVAVRFLKAWPISAYLEIAALANDATRAEEDSIFLGLYNSDPEFISKLLAAVTNYVRLPKQSWDIYRALVECQHEWGIPEACERLARGRLLGVIDLPDGGLVTSERIPFSEILTEFKKELPHLYGSKDNLRKATHRVIKSRMAILADWSQNLEARVQVGSLRNLDSLPCEIRANYYQINPPAKIRRKKPSKM